MAEAAERAATATIPGAAPIQLYKNSTDNKGASYGCHENYLMRRATRSPTSAASSRALVMFQRPEPAWPGSRTVVACRLSGGRALG